MILKLLADRQGCIGISIGDMVYFVQSTITVVRNMAGESGFSRLLGFSPTII